MFDINKQTEFDALRRHRFFLVQRGRIVQVGYALKKENNSFSTIEAKGRGKGLKKKQVIFSLLILALIGYGVYWAFFDMSRLPKGDKIAEASSPDGTYTIKAYVSSGGATTDNAVRRTQF